MQDSVYKALKRQWIQLKEMQLSASEWQPLEGFENLVFVGKNGKPITEHTFQVTLDWIEKSINKERKKQAEKNKTVFIPIPHFYPHALRHTFATRCFEAGIDAKVVQGFLGHYSIAITLDLYTHVTDDKQNRKWINYRICIGNHIIRTRIRKRIEKVQHFFRKLFDRDLTEADFATSTEQRKPANHKG